MIESHLPVTWQELQETVARILRECGVDAEVEKTVATARGNVTVDVWAHDAFSAPAQTYLVECKRWKSSVPQTIVHAFRSVVGDSGANWGALISSSGFQPAARAAAQYSNVRLLGWEDFQALFEPTWTDRYFVPAAGEAGDPLIEYTEPINSRIFQKADQLSETKRQQFKELRRAYAGLGVVALAFRSEQLGAARMLFGARMSLKLPLRSAFAEIADAGFHLPDEVLDAVAMRDLLVGLRETFRGAIEQFDEVFGGRA